jgi:hypothetical protein
MIEWNSIADFPSLDFDKLDIQQLKTMKMTLTYFKQFEPDSSEEVKEYLKTIEELIIQKAPMYDPNIPGELTANFAERVRRQYGIFLPLKNPASAFNMEDENLYIRSSSCIICEEYKYCQICAPSKQPDKLVTVCFECNYDLKMHLINPDVADLLRLEKEDSIKRLQENTTRFTLEY